MAPQARFSLPWCVNLWATLSSFAMIICGVATFIDIWWLCILFGIYIFIYSIIVFITELSTWIEIPFIQDFTALLKRQPYWAKAINYAVGAAPMFACLKLSGIFAIVFTFSNAVAYLALFILARDTDPATAA
eukprot:comp12790_c0_seq1/m.7931 comp12790_c0_seq1/g.7931  ORF comp12790_c0_seq1/g.7931 comp12790_c0_seq1/m.7931 type:complete len:132 (-) comp12790_c0_seq1:305-700(-)